MKTNVSGKSQDGRGWSGFGVDCMTLKQHAIPALFPAPQKAKTFAHVSVHIKVWKMVLSKHFILNIKRQIN